MKRTLFFACLLCWSSLTFAHPPTAVRVAAAEKAAAEQPNDLRRALRLGYTFLHAGMTKRARAVLLQLNEHFSNHAATHRFAAAVALERSVWTLAKTHASRCIKMEANAAPCHRMLAKALTHLKETDAAAASWQRALALEPRANDVQRMASVLVDAGQTRRAHQVLRHWSEHLDAPTLLLGMQLQTGAELSAWRDVESAASVLIARGHAPTDGLLARANARIQLDNEKDARADLRQALVLAKHRVAVHDSALARRQLGSALLANGDAEGALRWFESSAALAPRLAAARRGMSQARRAMQLESSEPISDDGHPARLEIK